MEQFKLLGMTAVLTALIWATADSLVNETIGVQISFAVVPEAGKTDMIAEVDRELPPFQVEVSGPHRVIAQVQAAAPLNARISVPDTQTGPTSIPLLKALEDQWNAFPKLTVLSVKPPDLEVAVDHFVPQEFRVALRPFKLAYEFEPQLERNTVTVRMRESRLREMLDARKPLEIQIDPERLLRDKTPGESVTVPVRLTLNPEDFGDDAEVTPNTLQVTATLKADRKTAEIGTVPILLAVSFANFAKPLKAIGPDGTTPLVTRRITVTGPVEAVDRLLAGDRPVGIIRLKVADLENLGVQRSFKPEFHLPPGVELAEEPEPVTFTILPLE